MGALKECLKKVKSEYAVVGFDDKGDFELLYEADFLSSAQQWMDRYTRWGDFGGWHSIVAVDTDTITAQYYMQLHPH